MERKAAEVLQGATTTMGRLRGVTPTQQVRSEATFQALIQAGRQALKEKFFDEMTIEKIASAAHTSVGAFYGRFENKEMFFSAIQEITVSDIEAQLRACLADPVVEATDIDAFFAAIAKFTVGVFREHRGLYVASFKHSSTRPGAWSPIRRLGYNAAGLVARKLAPRLEKLGKPVAEREIRVALQFVHGLLVNAVLNDPGPLSLDDEETEAYIARFLYSFFFGIEARGNSRRARPPKGRRYK